MDKTKTVKALKAAAKVTANIGKAGAGAKAEADRLEALVNKLVEAKLKELNK